MKFDPPQPPPFHRTNRSSLRIKRWRRYGNESCGTFSISDRNPWRGLNKKGIASARQNRSSDWRTECWAEGDPMFRTGNRAVEEEEEEGLPCSKNPVSRWRPRLLTLHRRLGLGPGWQILFISIPKVDSRWSLGWTLSAENHRHGRHPHPLVPLSSQGRHPVSRRRLGLSPP